MNKTLYKYIMMACIICLSCLVHTTDGYAKTREKTSGIITLSETKRVVKKGKRFRLKAIVHEKHFQKRKILWSSNKKKVAAVSASGLIRAKRNGTAIITARIKGTKYRAKCKVIVGVPVKKISFSEKKMKIRVGSSQYLKVNVFPKKASIRKVSYTSTDESVVSVSSAGKIIGRKPGTSQIKAVSLDGNKKTATITITVYYEPSISENEVSPLKPDAESTDSVPEVTENEPDQGGTDSESGQEKNNASEYVTIFMTRMEEYSAFIREYGAYFYKSQTATVESYQEAYDLVTKGESVGINCASPINWALKEMGLIPSGQIYGSGKGFVIKGSKTKELLYGAADFMNNSPALGLSVQQASDLEYLYYGDILSIVIDDTRAHTLVYIGRKDDGHAIVYEAGNIPYNLGYTTYGCGPLDYFEKNNYIITEIMRLH